MDDQVVFIFPNGNIATCIAGQQVPELQKSFIVMFAENCRDHGYDPTKFVINMPDKRKAKIFETENGFNWEFIG